MVFLIHTEDRQCMYILTLRLVQWELGCSIRNDGHEEANSRFWQLCERVWKWTILSEKSGKFLTSWAIIRFWRSPNFPWTATGMWSVALIWELWLSKRHFRNLGFFANTKHITGQDTKFLRTVNRTGDTSFQKNETSRNKQIFIPRGSKTAKEEQLACNYC